MGRSPDYNNYGGNYYEYGKYYCVNVDNAVYQGFRPDFTCTPISTSISWGGDCCKFDWGHPLSAEDNEALAEYVDTFGQEYLDMLDTISLDEIYPFEV